MSRNPDPKHGRWMLPLVVAGIILFTYSFVNSLPPATLESSDSTTTTGPASTTTTTTETTTTTLPSEVSVLIGEANGFASTATALLDAATKINTDWDNRDVGLSVITVELDRIASEADALATTVSGVEAPPSLSLEWADVVAAAANLASSAEDMVTGLAAPDTGQARRAALEAYQTASAAFTGALEAVTTAATS